MYRSGPASPREQFLDQFEMDGSDWLYRYKMTGAAYRVTGTEMDRFVAAYDRRQRWSWWIGVPIVSVIVFLLIWATDDPAPGSFLKALKPFVTGSGPLLILALRFPIDHFTFRAPLRVLALRPPVAPAWSREERQRLALDRIPSEILFGASVVCAILLAIFLVEGGVASGYGRIFIACFAAILLWSAITGFRKWQLARADAAIMSPTI